MELQFHPEIASWSFYRGMAFPNFVYLSATTGGDSNSSYKLQEPACTLRKGTHPDLTSCTKGFGSKMHSFSCTLLCLRWLQRHAQIPQLGNLVLLSHVYLAKESQQSPDDFWTFRPVAEECKSGCFHIPSSIGGLPPHEDPTNCTALGSSKDVLSPEKAKHIW